MLKDKKVIIVGGSSGIGLSIAHACFSQEAKVTIAGRDKDRLDKARSIIGEGIHCIQTDAASNNDIDDLYEEVGSFNHLVVSAGKALVKTLAETTEQDARDDMEHNFWLKFKLSTRAQPYLSEKGSILFISGAFASKPNPNLFMSSISVSAVEALSKSLALAAAPIRVNTIAPYVIDTSDITGEELSQERKAFLSNVREKIPAHHIGKGHDVGQAAVMLLSNPYASGMTLSLDGAYSLT